MLGVIGLPFLQTKLNYITLQERSLQNVHEECFYQMFVDVQWHRWTLEDLLSLILTISKLGANFSHILAKAFYLFDPVSVFSFMYAVLFGSNRQKHRRRRQTDKQESKQADRQTNRQTSRKAGRQTDRQTSRKANRQTDGLCDKVQI